MDRAGADRLRATSDLVAPRGEAVGAADLLVPVAFHERVAVLLDARPPDAEHDLVLIRTDEEDALALDALDRVAEHEIAAGAVGRGGPIVAGDLGAILSSDLDPVDVDDLGLVALDELLAVASDGDRLVVLHQLAEVLLGLLVDELAARLVLEHQLVEAVAAGGSSGSATSSGSGARAADRGRGWPG